MTEEEMPLAKLQVCRSRNLLLTVHCVPLPDVFSILLELSKLALYKRTTVQDRLIFKEETCLDEVNHA
jgi:hypothetical protein